MKVKNPTEKPEPEDDKDDETGSRYPTLCKY